MVGPTLGHDGLVGFFIGASACLILVNLRAVGGSSERNSPIFCLGNRISAASHVQAPEGRRPLVEREPPAFSLAVQASLDINHPSAV